MLGSTLQASAFAVDQKSVSDLCTVQVMDNAGTVKYVNAVNHNGTWYFSVDFFSEYTDYEYDANRSHFVIDGGKTNNAGTYDDVFRKLVKIDTAKKTIGVKNAVMDLEDIIMVNGKLYLPGYQVLPYLDTACTVQDNTLIISKAGESFGQLLDKFFIDTYYFDGDGAFGSKYARKAAEGFTWVWDTITNFRLDRLVTLDSLDEDVRSILVGYMTDQDGRDRYFSDFFDLVDDSETMLKRNKSLQRIMSKGGQKPFLTQVLDVNNSKNKDVFFPKEMQDASDGFWEAYEESRKETKIPSKLLGWGEKLALSSMDFSLNAMAMVDDQVDMLLAVFPDMQKNDGKWETEAQFLYDAYKQADAKGFGVDFGRNLLDLIYNDIVLDGGFDLVFSCVSSAPISGIKATEAMDDLAVLEYHLAAQEKARKAFEGYLKDINVNGNYTQKNLEKMRLSAIMMLLVSKKCYAIIRDNCMNLFATKEQVRARETCEAAINQITEMLARLYAAGAYVLADGQEYFEAAVPKFREQFAALNAIDDSLLKHYWNYLLQEGITQEKDLYVFMEDINADGLDELFVSNYRSDESTVSAYSYVGGEITQIDVQTQDEEDGTVKCVYLTDDEAGNTGLLTVRASVDTYEMEKALKAFQADMLSYALDVKKLSELIFSCIETVDWEFTVFDRNGINDIPDYGLWIGGKDKPQVLLNALAQYQGTELLLFRNGDGEIMKLLDGQSAFAHNPIQFDFWFDVIRERYDNKPVPEHELETPVSTSYLGEVSLPAVLFEYSALLQSLSQYCEFSYLVRDADLDGDNELLAYLYDDMEGFDLVLTADLNNGAVTLRENSSAAGGLSFAEHSPDGRTLLKEYYFSAMNAMTSYYEWNGTGWEQAAYMEENTEEDSSGNWVTKGSGTWWGQTVTSEEFREKEGAEIADILRDYNPDMACLQLAGNPSDYLEALYRYLRDERAAYSGLDSFAPLVAYNAGDLDLDGNDEDIFVVVRPADPWLSRIQQEQYDRASFPAEDDCAFIVVADEINNTTLQIVVSYHWDDFDGEIFDSDILVKNGVLYVKDAEFAYNGTYIANMDFIG